jgi:GNAT superfamily N-acetyltransferase
MNITYTNTISVKDYNALRESVGWRVFRDGLAKKSLAGSSYKVVAYDGEKAVAIGRVISDGGYVAYFADFIVRPEYQHKGIASEIMRQLIELAKSQLEDGDPMDMVLLTAKGKEPFYERFGFQKRPDEHFGHGMGQWITK